MCIRDRQKIDYRQTLPVLEKIEALLENSHNTSAEFVQTFLLLQELITKAKRQVLPTETKLFQNYPNPFNPETWMPYQLAKDGDVTIIIYNPKGQLIRLLKEGRKNAGVYVTKDKVARWDGKDSMGEKVTSGVYFYTLRVGDFTVTRKMIILK